MKNSVATPTFLDGTAPAVDELVKLDATVFEYVLQKQEGRLKTIECLASSSKWGNGQGKVHG